MENKKYYGTVDVEHQYHLDQYIEKLLLEHFGIDRDGVFVDVGAYHPTYLSNSYYFEKDKGFKVICIEPNPAMVRELDAKRSHVYSYAVSDENETVDFQVVQGDWDSFGYAGSGLHTFEGERGKTTAVNAHSIKHIKVLARTLNYILNLAQVDQIDAISIDTEGHEKAVLDGLDFEKYAPKVCCIENYFEDSWLYEYMEKKGYTFVKRLSVDDFFIKK